jgi:uncharacterized protein YjbJ (UPF0337 family)/regulator of replication initiation timing
MAKKAKKGKRVAKQVAALSAEVASLKTQMARLRTEQRTALKAEIESLHKKLRAESQQVRQKTVRAVKEAKGGPEALREKVAKVKDETKPTAEAKAAGVRNKPQEPVASVEQPPGSATAADPDLNKQEVKGREEQAEGKSRGAKGKKAGDWEEQIKGKAEEVKGTVREAVGRTARKIDEK